MKRAAALIALAASCVALIEPAASVPAPAAPAASQAPDILESATPVVSLTASPSASLSPEAIYLRATRAMKDAPEPAYVTFDEDVTARNMRLACTADGETLEIKHGDAAGTYHVWFRTRDESAVSEDAHGQKRCKGALLQPTGTTVTTLGAPSAAPSATPTPSADGPPIIAAVRVESARYYRIALVDREAFEGHPVYRLSLHAYRDPISHPLTSLLVDVDSFLIRQASGEAGAHLVVASGSFAGTVTFEQSGPYWLARDERFEFAAQAIFVHARCTVSVHASGFAFPADIAGVFPSPSPSPKARR